MGFKVVATYEHPIRPLDRKAFEQIRVEFIQKACHTEDEIIAIAGDADAVIPLIEEYTPRVIENLKKCRLIVTPKVGLENIDVAAATEHGILVANAGELCREEVAEHTMALLLACARKLKQLHKAAEKGLWTGLMCKEIRQIWPPMSRISGQTLGLIGFGRIARTLVPKAKGFGLNIIAYDPYISEAVAKEFGVELVSLEHLLQESDYISLHAAQTKENYHLLGLNELKKMKPTAYIINTARGALIDEQALYTALKEGYIAGAGLDVLETEYIRPDNPLLGLDNVIISCHSAHYSDTSFPLYSQLPAEEIARIMRGELPKNLVNPQAVDKYWQKWGKKGK